MLYRRNVGVSWSLCVNSTADYYCYLTTKQNKTDFRIASKKYFSLQTKNTLKQKILQLHIQYRLSISQCWTLNYIVSNLSAVSLSYRWYPWLVFSGVSSTTSMIVNYVQFIIFRNFFKVWLSVDIIYTKNLEHC